MTKTDNFFEGIPVSVTLSVKDAMQRATANLPQQLLSAKYRYSENLTFSDFLGRSLISDSSPEILWSL